MSTTAATGRPVPVRVELPAGQTAVMRVPGAPDVPIDAATLASLFALGLQIPPKGSDQPEGNSTLEVDEATRCYVGATPFPIDLALAAIARAIERAIHEAAEDLRASEPAKRSTAAPLSDREVVSGMTRVPLQVAEENFEAIIDRVEAGERIVLTQQEEAVAVVAPWAEYRQLREKLARMQLAYWSVRREDGWYNLAEFRRLADGAVD